MSIEKAVHQLAKAEMYSFKTINDFGWADHLNSSLGGIVVNFKDESQALIYVIDNILVLDDPEYLNESETNDVKKLIKWIEAQT